MFHTWTNYLEVHQDHQESKNSKASSQISLEVLISVVAFKHVGGTTMSSAQCPPYDDGCTVSVPTGGGQATGHRAETPAPAPVSCGLTHTPPTSSPRHYIEFLALYFQIKQGISVRKMIYVSDMIYDTEIP